MYPHSFVLLLVLIQLFVHRRSVRSELLSVGLANRTKGPILARQIVHSRRSEVTPVRAGIIFAEASEGELWPGLPAF